MKWFRRVAAVLSVSGALVGQACRRDKPVAAADSSRARPVPAADTAAAAVATSTWDPSAGVVLLVGTDNPTRALLVPPVSGDTTVMAAVPHQALVIIMGRDGTVQTADAPSVADSAGCLVASLTAAPPPHAWAVGFIGGVVNPIPVDSSVSLAHDDSLRLTASLTRLASALPNDSAGRFTGLPFVVQSIWRFSLADGSQVIVGTLTRQINQEATPLQERTLIVGERRGGDTTLTMGYSERSFGREETIESADLLAALLIGDSKTPAIVLARDYGDSNAYSLLERAADGHWRVRWSSRRQHC